MALYTFISTDGIYSLTTIKKQNGCSDVALRSSGRSGASVRTTPHTFRQRSWYPKGGFHTTPMMGAGRPNIEAGVLGARPGAGEGPVELGRGAEKPGGA